MAHFKKPVRMEVTRQCFESNSSMRRKKDRLCFCFLKIKVNVALKKRRAQTNKDLWPIL